MRTSTLASAAVILSACMAGGVFGQSLSQPLSVQPVGFGDSGGFPTAQAPVAQSHVAIPQHTSILSQQVMSPAPAPTMIGSGVQTATPMSAMPANEPVFYNTSPVVTPPAAAPCGCSPTAPACNACSTTAACPQPTCNQCGGSGCSLGSCLGLGGGGVPGVGIGSLIPGLPVAMQMLKSASSGACNCDPWTLSGAIHGDCPPCIEVGGWFQGGYHTESNGLFNDREDELNLHQAWLTLSKSATSDSPLGFRADIMYGIDGTDTQSLATTQATGTLTMDWIMDPTHGPCRSCTWSWHWETTSPLPQVTSTR